MLFSSTTIKKQSNEREVDPDSKISVLYPPVLPLKVETSTYFWHSRKTYKKEKTGLAHMWGRAGGQLLLALFSWATQLNLHICCELKVSEALECTPDLQREVNPQKELHLDPGAPLCKYRCKVVASKSLLLCKLASSKVGIQGELCPAMDKSEGALQYRKEAKGRMCS